MRKKKVGIGILGIILILAVFFGYLSWRSEKNILQRQQSKKKEAKGRGKTL